MPTALRSATRSQFRKSVVVPTIHSRRILPLLEPPRSQVTFCVRGVVSPLLANVYLHYAFDVWVQHWREHRATGDVIIVRYADDIVMGFEQRADAERFLQEWKERLRKFGLELHPDKTRLIEFGRFAAEDRKRRGQGKPETFNFLGFTHICAKNRKTGGFSVDRKTIRKRLSAKLKAVREELRRRWHEPVAEVGKWLRSVVPWYKATSTTMRFLATSIVCRAFGLKSSGTGPARYNGGARRVGCLGTVSVRLSLGGSRVL